MSERRQGSAARGAAGRLSRSAEFDRVYRQGRSVANRYLVMYSFPRGGEGQARIGLSVGRKIGGAVERNLVKRLLREAFAAIRADLAPGYDVVVIARPEVGQLAVARGLDGVAGAVAELLSRTAAHGRERA